MANTILAKLAASVGLSALFLVVYGGCNWITAQRSDVGTIFFAWERHIPFVPLMIAPYLSIDLFFIAAPFLCRSNRELATFTRRIALAIVVAGICFLAFPRRFAFARPHTDGWLGVVFDWFRTMDAPFNLFPSLHITLGALLVVTYARHTRGWMRILVTLWFALIMISAVLTYQHHVLDVVGGFALAGYCFYFVREEREARPVERPSRIHRYYAWGALVLVAGAIVLWPWGALLLWPALALALMCRAYRGGGAAVFRKTNGILPWSTWWALGPVLMGQHLSRIYYRRQCPAWNAITPNVWIGRALSEHEAEQAVRAGVTAVLDLTTEFSAPRAFRAVTYRNVALLDLTAPSWDEMTGIARFIAAEARGGVVYVHCKIGYSRSAAAVGAYLLEAGTAKNPDDAMAQLRAARPPIVIRPEAQRALRQFQDLKTRIWCSRLLEQRVSNAAIPDFP